MQKARIMLENDGICPYLLVGLPNRHTKQLDRWYCERHLKELPNQGVAMVYCCQNASSYGNCWFDTSPKNITPTIHQF